MKIAFNPSTVAALITPPNNKDITFDLRGRNIFARGVKFQGTDTWRDIKINNVSIDSNILDLQNGSNTTLTNTNGVVTINSTWRPVVDNLTSDSTTSSLSANLGRVLAGLINGKSDSGHNHDGRYLRLNGSDTMQGNLYLHSYGTSYIGKGSGDKSGADFTEANIVIRSWWGISFKSHDDIVRTYIDTRTGNIGTKGVLNAVGAVIQGRVYNDGDDEGIIIKPASNGYAGLILGAHNSERSVFYLTKGNPFWRYNNGSANLDIKHPKKSGTIALTSDIPSSLKNPYSLTTFGIVYDGSAAKTVTTSTFISLVTEGTSTVTDGTMFITSYASNSGFADTNAVNVPYKRKAIHLWEYIKAKTDSLYATKGHNHDDRYLKLTGGIMTGTIYRNSGGSTISGRDHAIIRLTYAPGGSSWNPIACVDTETGTWTLGHLSSGDSNTNFHFCFSTNADYNAGNNNGNYVTLRNKVGTIALLSEIPDKNSWNYDDRYLKLTGGTMNGNARIGYGSGNLYIGNSGNDGWVAVQDICSQDSIGDGKWSIRVDGTASFQSIKFPSNRLIAQVSNGSNSPLRGIKLPRLDSNAIGIFSRVGNGSDEGGIVLSEDTCVIYNSFDTGWGLSVRDKDINLTDISGDNTIAFGVRQDYRAYSLGGFEKSGSNNSYVLLGGGGHKLESSLNVANADKVDGYHYNDFTYKKYIGYNRNGPYNMKIFSKDISSLTWDSSHLIFDIFSSGYSNNRVYFGRYEVSLGHWNNTDKNPTVYSRWIFKTNSAYDCVHVIKDLSNYTVDVYIENNLWDSSMGLSIVAIDGFNMVSSSSWVNLPSVSSNVLIINTTYLSFIGNSSSATKLLTARKLWGLSFDGTADVSGTLSGVANILFSANNAYDIGSNSAASRYIYTHWLGARTGLKLELGANNSSFGLGLCIDTNLNVGIGTNTPAYKLHVAGDIYTTTGFKKNGSSDSYVLLGGGGHKALSDFSISEHTHSSITIPVCSSLDENSDVFRIEYAGGSNSVATKPSGVDAFGVIRLRTAAGWYGQIMMSANTAPGIYYRNANGLSSSVGWKKLLDSSNFNSYSPKLDGTGASGTWNISITGNANTVDNIHATGFLRWKGMLNIGSNAPFQAVVDIMKDTSKLNDGGLAFYSYANDEYTVLIGSRNDATRHGNALKWGYANKYLWMIRMINGSPRSSDWEKISAGYADSSGNADTVDGLHVHSGRNNEANKIVRTDANGYILAGLINTTSGDMGTTTATRIYCSNDAYIRYKTLANFSSDIAGQLYWANVKVSTSSNAATSPTFESLWINNSYFFKLSGTTFTCQGGTTFTLPSSNINTSTALLWTTASDGTRDTGIFYNSSDFAFIANSNDHGAVFAVYDTDVTQDFEAGAREISVPGSGGALWARGGFSKNGSSNNYVLLGGGGHKLESALNVANADTVDGYHASSLVKFYLSPMANDAPADSAKSWFINTMPSASGAIVYNVPGSEKTIIAGKSSGAFGHMLQLNYDDTYLRILRYYSGSWKSTDWEKISAGYADSAGSVSWNNITGKPSSYTPSAHTHSWASITDKLVAGNEFNIVNAGFNADIWFNYKPINDSSKTASIHTYIMGNGAKGMASVTASGFIKNGSNSNYVLLGDGGHQTISSLSVNYATSAGYANGIASKGLLDSQEKIDNFITTNRFEYAIFKTAESNNVGFDANDGMILSIPWDSTTYGAQIAFDDVLAATVKVRSKSGNWGNWYTLLHSGNYNSYSPTLTGTGASGTWGINITGNADTVDGYHATSGNDKPWGTIPAITTSGWMDIGKHLEFHFDNTTGSDYSTILRCTGNYSNIVNLPSAAGTLALTSDIPTSLPANGGNADTTDGVHITWAGELTSTNHLVAWEADGSALRDINPANISVGYASSAGNADKLDGYHASELLTALSNSNNGISITVGGTTKSISNISVNYAASAGSANSAIQATNLTPENTPHYFRDPSNSSWRGGMYWGSAGNESMSFVATNGGTRFQFVGGSDIANWTSSTWQSVTPYLTIYSSGIVTPGSVTATNGFIKSNSSDSYVLLGGGGHKLESSLRVAYATSAGSVDTALYLRSLGNLNCQTGRTLNYGDVYTYNTYDGNTGSPTTFTSVIGFGRGIAGTVEIAGGWDNTNLYWRSLRDCCEDWHSWRTVLDSSNYSEFINNYYWANIKISTSSSTTTSPTVHTLTATRVCAGYNPEIDNSISCSNWFRSSGATGWYNATYLGGWYMSDTSWIRAHNGVGIYTSGQIYSSSSIRMGNLYLLNTNEINSTSGIHLNYQNSGNISLCYGGGKVGIGTTSPTYKLDVNGDIHSSGTINCNALNVGSTLSIKDSVISCSASNISIESKESGSLLVNSREVLSYNSDRISMTNKTQFVHRLGLGASSPDPITNIHSTDDVTVYIGSLTESSFFEFRPAMDGLLLFLKIGKLHSNTYFWCTARNCEVIRANNFSTYLNKNQNKDCFGDGCARIFIYKLITERWYEFYCG